MCQSCQRSRRSRRRRICQRCRRSLARCSCGCVVRRVGGVAVVLDTAEASKEKSQSCQRSRRSRRRRMCQRCRRSRPRCSCGCVRRVGRVGVALDTSLALDNLLGPSKQGQTTQRPRTLNWAKGGPLKPSRLVSNKLMLPSTGSGWAGGGASVWLGPSTVVMIICTYTTIGTLYQSTHAQHNLDQVSTEVGNRLGMPGLLTTKNAANRTRLTGTPHVNMRSCFLFSGPSWRPTCR